MIIRRPPFGNEDEHNDAADIRNTNKQGLIQSGKVEKQKYPFHRTHVAIKKIQKKILVHVNSVNPSITPFTPITPITVITSKMVPNFFSSYT